MKPQSIVAVEVSEGMALFCSYLLQGYEPHEAAKAAGYAEARAMAPMLMRHPQVRKALAEGSAAMVECELVPLSITAARDILKDQDPKARAIRAKLALGVLDRAAKNIKERTLADNPAAALSKLSTDELADLVARGLAAEAQEASTINITPVVVRNAMPKYEESLSITEAWGLV